MAPLRYKGFLLLPQAHVACEYKVKHYNILISLHVYDKLLPETKISAGTDKMEFHDGKNPDAVNPIRSISATKLAQPRNHDQNCRPISKRLGKSKGFQP